MHHRILAALRPLRQDLATPPRRGRRPRRLPPRRAPLARLPADPRRHPPLVRRPGPPRQHRPDPRLAPGRPLVHRRGLLPGAGTPAPGGLPGRAPRPDRGPRPGHPHAGHLARPPHLPGRRLVLLDARHARAAGPLRHLGPGQARLQLPGGPHPGPVPRRHRAAAGGPRRPAAGPRDGRPSAASTPTSAPGDVLVGDRGFCSFAAPGDAGRPRRPRGVPHPPPADRRLHAGPAARRPRRQGGGPRAARGRAGCGGSASATRWSSGSSRAGGRSGWPRTSSRPCPRR